MESNDDRARLLFLLHGVTDETRRPKKEVLVLSILSSESSSLSDVEAGRFLPDSEIPPPLAGTGDRCAVEAVPGVRK